MKLATTLGLTILNLTSLTLLVSPRFLNEPYAFAIRTTSVAAPFVRAAFVLRMISASTYYVLIEFFVALVSIGLFALEYVPIQGSVLWLQVVAPVLSFLGVEVLLFASVQTSGGNPGYFGLLHNALWALLRNVGAGVVVLSEGVATLAEGVGIAVAGVSAAAAARQAEGPLDDEEHGAARQGRGLLGTEERGAARQGGELSDAEERGEEDPEARPPPPYYDTVALDNVVLRDIEKG